MFAAKRYYTITGNILMGEWHIYHIQTQRSLCQKQLLAQKETYPEEFVRSWVKPYYGSLCSVCEAIAKEINVYV